MYFIYYVRKKNTGSKTPFLALCSAIGTDLELLIQELRENDAHLPGMYAVYTGKFKTTAAGADSSIVELDNMVALKRK